MKSFCSKKVNVKKKIQTNLITKQPFILYLLIIQTKVIVKYDDKGFIAPTFITKQAYLVMNFIRSVIVNMGFLGLKRHYIAVEISLGAISEISEKSNLIILLQVIAPLSLTKTSRFFAVDWNGISSTWWPQWFRADGKLWLAVLSLINKTWASKWIITQAMAGC